MKQRTHQKLLKICIAESLLQCGFQRTTEKTIDVFTDTTSHLINQISSKIAYNDTDLVLKTLLDAVFGKNEYALDEIFDLLKVNKGQGESVLHTMNILPRNIDWKGKGGGLKFSGFFEQSEEFKQAEEKSDAFDHNIYDFIDDINKKCVDNSKRVENEKSVCNNLYPHNIESEKIDYDDPLVIKIYDRGGWISTKDYEKILEKGIGGRKDLVLYDLELGCDTINELYCFIYKEVDKSDRENNIEI